MNNSIYKLSKYFLLSLFIFIFSVQLNAQTSTGIFFQAVAKDNFSNPAKSRKVYIQSTIIQSAITGKSVLIEEHQTSTDIDGVFSISIGNGLIIGGAASNLSGIDWSNGPFFLNIKIAITPVFNNNWDYTKEWVDLGTTSFGAVPYALFTNSANAATKLATARKINGVAFDGTADITITSNTGTLTGTTNANLTGEVISTGNITTITNDAVIGKLLTGYTAGTGTIIATDNILQAIQKMDGNVALKATIASPAFTGTPTAITAASRTNSTQIATTAYVDAAITSVSAGTASGTSTTPDATASVKGKMQLAGDLSGTADAPTVAALAITTLKIADNAIITAKISDLTISAAKIANNAVTTAKILDANVTTAKILDANVTTAKIADANVTTAKILDANVTTAKIADANVTTVKILDANVTTAKIADANITTVKILDANVTGIKIASGTISNTNLVNVPSKTFKGRTDAADGVVQDLTVAQVKTDLAINLVDNTSDASKPVSTATQTALDLKATIASPAFTGTPTAVTAALGTNSTQIATTAYVDAANRTIFSTGVSLSSAATPAPVGSSLFNFYTLTAQSTSATFDAPSGTPLDGNSLVLKIKASGAEIALSWNTIYRGGTDISLPTITNKTTILQFMYNTADAKWDLVGITNGI